MQHNAVLCIWERCSLSASHQVDQMQQTDRLYKIQERLLTDIEIHGSKLSSRKHVHTTMRPSVQMQEPLEPSVTAATEQWGPRARAACAAVYEGSSNNAAASPLHSAVGMGRWSALQP